MHIAIDLQAAQSESRLGGIGRYTMSLVQAIARSRSGHEITLVLNGLLKDSLERIRSAFDGLLPQESIRVWYAPGPLRADDGNAARRAAAQLIREAFLSSLKPDVVLVPSLFEGFIDDAVTSVGLFDPAVPTAAVLYDLIPLVHPELYLTPFPGYEPYYRTKLEYLRRADLLLAISEFCKQEAVQEAAIPAERIATVGAAAASFFHRVEPPADSHGSFPERFGITKPFVMYAGGADPRKNLERLTEAFAQLPAQIRDSFQLGLVGGIPPSRVQELKRAAKGHGLGSVEVVMTGYVTDEELRALYSACSLFVFPSLHEGFGLPVLEAMACGAPVLAANSSSLPEVIGRQDLLFDPYDASEMGAKIAQVLTDQRLSRELSAYGIRRAAEFSWEKCAQRTVAALEQLRREFVPQRPIRPAERPGKRPRLAFVSPLPPEKTGIASYSAALLPELSRHYQIEVVTPQAEVAAGWVAENCPLRSPEWFLENAAQFDRVLYQFGNSPHHAYMFDLLELHPGVVVLHDFFLSSARAEGEAQGRRPAAWSRELLHSHGYRAVAECWADPLAAELRYPCNLSVLQQAQGVIVHSAHAKQLAASWYGEEVAAPWRVIARESAAELPGDAAPVPPSSAEPGQPAVEPDRLQQSGAAPEQLSRRAPQESERRCADLYAEAIEQFFAAGQTSPSALPGAMAASRALKSASQSDLEGYARALVRSFKPIGLPRQLFVDVSAIARVDLRTGTHRVTRGILKQLLRDPPEGYRVEPVRAAQERLGYSYARRFTMGFLGYPGSPLEDEPIDFYPGDIFLGLDFACNFSLAQERLLEQMRGSGVHIWFFVHDLLPVLHPEWFPAGDTESFAQWLELVGGMEGAICSSSSTAGDLRRWLVERGRKGLLPFHLAVCPIAADIEESQPSRGMPEGAEKVLESIRSRRSFLMVGTIEPRKGHLQAIRAFDLLWEEGLDVNLIIVGRRGWMVDDPVALLRSHPELGKRLFWLEAISDEYLERVYQAASCLICASEGEGFGLPIIEGAKHGLPLIVRDIPVFREVAGIGAFYFSGKEAADLAAAVRVWLELAKSARVPSSTPVAWLTWEQSASRLKDVLTCESERERLLLGPPS
jgi:glycosyltransferase involved in cell wall biosynthesis